MTSNTETRASDADRDRTVAALREHLAAGRLTHEEFDERMDNAYAAKTLGELDRLMADLPEAGPGQLPDAPADRPGRVDDGVRALAAAVAARRRRTPTPVMAAVHGAPGQRDCLRGAVRRPGFHVGIAELDRRRIVPGPGD